MNIAAWLYKGEWHLFTSKWNRVVKDQAHYQANLKKEEARDLVLIRVATGNINAGYWFHFVPAVVTGNYIPVIYTQEIPKELRALLTIYGL